MKIDSKLEGDQGKTEKPKEEELYIASESQAARFGKFRIIRRGPVNVSVRAP